MDGETLAYLATALTISGIVIGGLVKWVIRPLAGLYRRVHGYLDTFYGEPERDGLARRPGIVDRLIWIEAELRPNGGSSLRDVVNRLETGQGEAKDAAKAAADLAEQAATRAEEVAALAHEVHDELHEFVTEGQIREESYRETLREIHGIDLDPPPYRDPHARTRRDDEETT